MFNGENKNTNPSLCFQFFKKFFFSILPFIVGLTVYLINLGHLEKRERNTYYMGKLHFHLKAGGHGGRKERMLLGGRVGG